MNKLIKLLAVTSTLAISISAFAQDAPKVFASTGNTYTFNYADGSSNPDDTTTPVHYTDTFSFNLASASSITAFFAEGTTGALDIQVNSLPSFANLIPSNPAFSGITFDLTNLTLGPVTFAAGDYQLVFKRDSDSAFTGGINVAAVPEPETYAMLLAGLGLIGFSARRRQS